MRDAPAGDLDAIEGAVTDYFESWFDGDPARMESCLHPRLAKRRPPRGTESEIQDTSYDEMIEDAASGPKPQFDRRIRVTVLDVAGDIATARVESQPFDEYLHLARIDRRWRIVNALYRRRPGSGGSTGA